MTNRFLANGLEGFAPHEVLELLLFFSKPRVNTNQTAHELMERFGDLNSVFDAQPEELKEINGIGDSSALLIKLIPPLARRYVEGKTERKTINTAEEAGKYLISKFVGMKTEMIVMICLNRKNEIVGIKKYESGFSATSCADMEDIVKAGINMKAASVYFSHNHPGGTLFPSRQDIVTTEILKNRFDNIGIEFKDHIIVANNDYYSMKKEKILDSF